MKKMRIAALSILLTFCMCVLAIAGIAEPVSTGTANSTASPSVEATAKPTAEPTATPTAQPTATAKPTATPTATPSATVAAQTAEASPAPEAVPSLSPEAEVTALAGSEQISVQLFTQPQSIKLPKAETSYWFFLPAGSVINSAVLRLEMETTATLLEDYSTITLEVNGVAVSSMNLQELRDTKGSVWELEIPLERLNLDGSMNELKFVTAQRSILGDCADIDNPANWLVLKETSALTLSVQKFGPCTLSTLMNSMFNRFGKDDTLAAEFVLGDQDQKAETDAALSIASAIGASNPYKQNISLPVSLEKAKTELTNQFFISADTTAAQAPQISNYNGYLKVTEADGKTVAYVVGNGSEGLAKAMRVLLYPSYLSQLSGTEAEISSTITHDVADLPLNEAGMYTLEDYGYNDISLAGAFHQQTNFQIQQPNGVVGGPDSYFEIHFRHSDALLSDTSLLTVSFNNVPAASIQLSGMNATNGSLRVAIPKDALLTPIISVEVDAYNYLGKIDCSKDWYDVAWTVVDSDSTFYFQPTNTILPASLNNFPFLPPTSSDKEHEVMFYIPEADETTLTMASELAARAGQQAHTGLRCFTAPSITSASAASADIIAIGSTSSLFLPSEVQEKLYINIDPTSGNYTVSELIDSIPEALKGRVIIQATQSPYNSARVMYVIMWDDQFNVSELMTLMHDKNYLNTLNGQVAFSSLATGMQALDLVSDPESTVVKTAYPDDTVVLSVNNVELANRPITPELLINMAVNYTGISRIGLLMILVLLVLIVILIIRSVRVKNRFQRAKQNLETNGKPAKRKEKPADASESEKKDSDEDPDDFI